jgi:acyl-CoA reductase-like NAD-dependent aldehyde dehydrogenase
MQEITHVYINGRSVEPHGTELFDLHNPVTGEVFGRVRLGDADDARAAVGAAKRTFRRGRAVQRRIAFPFCIVFAMRWKPGRARCWTRSFGNTAH